MKRSLILTFLMLLLTFGVATADRLITVDPVNPIYPPSSTGETLGFNYQSDAQGQGAQNGFIISVTGPATADWVDGSQNVVPYTPAWLGWNFNYATAQYMLNGGAYLPGVFSGIPGDDVLRPAYTVDVAWTFTGDPQADTAEICVMADYPGLYPSFPGNWLWTAPDGVTNLNPGFNGGTDASPNPFCWFVGYLPCQDPAFTTTPAGDVVSGDHCVGANFNFTADPVEPGETITGYAIVDDGGLGASIDNSGAFTFPAADPGVYPVTISVSNSCPGSTEYTFEVNLTNSGLAYDACPTGVLLIPQGKTLTRDLGLDPFDCDPISESVAIDVNPTGSTPDVSVSGGVFTFNAVSDDVGIWTFTVTGTDGFGQDATCTFDVEVTATSTLGVRIAKIGDDSFVFQGTYTMLPIYLDYMGNDALGGFDFLIAYDASALTFVSAEQGDAISCWEYFTYRFGPFGNCGGTCPSGLLQLVAMREANDGPNHPTGCDGADGFFTTPDAELAKIKFYVTDDRTYECQYVPVYFYWLSCTDNAISDITGNTLFISNNVYNINWVDPSNPYYELEPPDGTIDMDEDYVFGAWDFCDDNPEPGKPVPIRDIDFYNGGVDIACADDIDLRGDLNLNNLANEIADAVLYTNYFIYGPAVFIVNLQGQIAASDVNNDGRVLTVGDLVYLIRILTGDAAPFDKLSPFSQEATVRQSNGTVTINSDVNVGAALFVFDGAGEATLLTEGMEIKQDVVDDQLRVLVYSTSTDAIAAGNSEVLSVIGDANLTEVEVSDYYGNMISTDVVKKIVPKAYALNQNAPNPFNPTTEVAFDLPESANWTLNVYNVAGQLVKSFSGYSDAGTVKVNVDASGWASGVYFYRLQANDYVDTKKMALMK